MNKKKYSCPVCAYDGLKEPPFGRGNEPSYEICPCCGFEFGFDGVDDRAVFAEFRRRWKEKGASWFTPGLKPGNWNLERQLTKLKKKTESSLQR